MSIVVLSCRVPNNAGNVQRPRAIRGGIATLGRRPCTTGRKFGSFMHDPVEMLLFVIIRTSCFIMNNFLKIY